MADAVKTVGRYEVQRELGRGGMAVVYLARQVDLDRLVALKELAAFHAADPAFAKRFVRESRMAGSITHSHVVTVFDYFEHEGMPYIAMEYLERGSLRPYVGRMSPAQIGGVLEGVLAGLSAAEGRGIIHRDLKPENLMVDSDGRVKIADFGIAKATQSSEMSAFVTATGATVGTPPYMSPEQAMAKEVGPWTDLYSVGCVAYELYTGRAPFIDADSPMAILLRHIGEPLPPAREVAGRRPGGLGLDRAAHGEGAGGAPAERDGGLGGAGGDPDRDARPALAARLPPRRAARPGSGPAHPAARGHAAARRGDRPRRDGPGHARPDRVRDVHAAADAAPAGRRAARAAAAASARPSHRRRRTRSPGPSRGCPPRRYRGPSPQRPPPAAPRRSPSAARSRCSPSS